MTKKFSTSSLSKSVVVSFVSVAASILLVGVVWASSSAITGEQAPAVAPGDSIPPDLGDNPTESTTVPEQPGDTDDERNYDELIQDLDSRLSDATAEIDSLSQDLAVLEQSSEATREDVAKATTRLTDLASEVTSMKEALKETTKLVTGFDERISSLAILVNRKTALINDEGKYMGTIAPSQISPQLRVTDVSGDWPLNRTTGDLNVSKLYFDGFSCSSDYRTHAVLTVDPFRRIACVRIPK